MRIPLSKPNITEREIEYVTRVLRSGHLTLGPCLGEFEARFAAYVGTRYAVAASSGTAALHLCVCALGIGAEDEVITSSFSFVASANCVLYEGALPVFVDIDPATLNIDPHKIQSFLRACCRPGTPGTWFDSRTGRQVKAILAVHVFGLPCEMEAIADLAREYKLFVIEDACEAIGAECHGRKVGTWGDAAVFAFYPNKQMTTAEGGIIATNDEHTARLCRSLRNQGREEGSSWLAHARLGYNYRLSDLHCALGLAQLERIDELLQARERVADAYTQSLAGHPGLTLPGGVEGMKRSWFVYVVQIDGSSTLRDRVVLRLRERGIGCQAYFPAIHRQPYFRECRLSCSESLPKTEAAADRCLALPFFSLAPEQEIAEVCETLLEVLREEAIPAGSAVSREAHLSSTPEF